MIPFLKLRLAGLLLVFGLILGAAALAGAVFNALMPQGIGWLPPEVAQPLWQEIDLSEARARHAAGALMVDARDPGVYKLAHVRGAVNLYPEELNLMWPLLEKQLRAAPSVVVYGRSQSRWPAAAIAQHLKKQGLADVAVMAATYDDWRAAGHPVRERKRRGGS